MAAEDQIVEIVTPPSSDAPSTETPPPTTETPPPDEVKPPTWWDTWAAEVLAALGSIEQLAREGGGATGKAWTVRPRAGADPYEVRGALAVHIEPFGVFIPTGRASLYFPNESELKSGLGSRYELEVLDQTAFAAALGRGDLKVPTAIEKFLTTIRETAVSAAAPKREAATPAELWDRLSAPTQDAPPPPEGGGDEGGA